jgi:N-acetylglucosamine-6-phosphate deacetylase
MACGYDRSSPDELLMRTAFTASRLYTPLDEVQNPLLVVEDARIAEVSSCSGKTVAGNARLVDFGDAVLAPGFFDIHIHGGAGLDVMLASPSDLPRLGKFLATHGVTDYGCGAARLHLLCAGTTG